jgi:hypothetical protein
MSTYNSESALARLLPAATTTPARTCVKRSSSSDVQIIDNALRVHLDPATA